MSNVSVAIALEVSLDRGETSLISISSSGSLRFPGLPSSTRASNHSTGSLRYEGEHPQQPGLATRKVVGKKLVIGISS